ncbi:MAG: hydrogenase iron-sulfur subunit [Actinomycetota bacterium]|nr:hydrogenase iron-sulfur subunit [Actinomycetota bacterium]
MSEENKGKGKSKKNAGDLRIGVFVCHCGANIGGFLDVNAVAEYAAGLPNVVHAEHNLYSCAEDGLAAIRSAIEEYDLNRVVVASCTPRTHEPLFRENCEEAGVNKYLFEFANIRDQCSWVHMKDWDRATRKAEDLVRMAVARAALLEPQEEIELDIYPAAMVIGGGVSGMTSALSIARQGFDVHLVEKEGELGGMLRYLYNIFPENRRAEEVISELRERVENEDRLTVHLNARIDSIDGYYGNFEVALDEGEGLNRIKVGTVVVATGADEFEPEGLYAYGTDPRIVTQRQLESGLKEGRFSDLKEVVMIQCVGSRGQVLSYCSRVCCATAVKNALALKELFPGVRVEVLHNDIQVYGQRYEENYRRAREAGVRFKKYDPERRPEASVEDGELKVRFHHQLMDRDLEYHPDLVVLSTPLVMNEGGMEVARMLRVPMGGDKFMFEAHVKLRPVDFATDGLYLCGTCHGPADITESVSQANAAASHAVNPMARHIVETEAITASVNEDACIGCGFCAWACPYGAPKLEAREDGKLVSRINEALCKGCGTCAAGCPSYAITTRHFRNDQAMAMIHTAFPEPSKPGPDFEPQIIAFTCNWCSYAGADLAGVSRFQYPPNIRIIRFMCSGRIDPMFVFEALRSNADAVLVSGCHIGDCHYIDANYRTRERFEALEEVIAELDVEPERLRLAWISASEGQKFAETIKEMVEDVKKLGPFDKSRLVYKASERV